MTTKRIDPFEVFSADVLQERQKAKSPKVAALTRPRLVELVTKAGGRKLGIGKTAAMELTARHPFDPAGFMDVYQPGRWDCESNLVFMRVIVTGPSPGMWEGTVVYARFKAPASGDYLVVANFSGHQITMNLHGPWGTNTAYCPTTSDSAAVTALWSGTSGKNLFFTINCTGPIMGYLESVQVFQLT